MAKKKKKKWIILCAAVVVIIGAGVALKSMISGMNSSVMTSQKYTVIAAETRDLSDILTTNGKVIGNETVDVNTKLNAVVSEVNVSLGDHVEAGDVLCVFDSSELQEEYDSLSKQVTTGDQKTEDSHEKNQRDLEAAQAKKTRALERAQRVIDRAVKARDDAYADYNKKVEEYNSHIGEETEPGELPYDFAAMDAQLEAQYAQLSTYDDAVTDANESYKDTETQYDESIQAIQDMIDAEQYELGGDSAKQLKKLKEQIDQCTVIAPQSGIITALNVNEGTIPMSSSIMTIVNMDKTVVELTVKETDIAKITEGMDAVVTSKVIPDEEMKAKITRIVHVLSADPTDPTSAGYKVEVTLDVPNDKLLIGMSASVDITLVQVGEKMSVPYSGVFEKDGAKYVYAAEKTGEDDGSYTAKLLKVSTGHEGDFYVEVTGGEVKDGDLIIEDPQGSDLLRPVEEGMRIYVNE